MRCKIYKICGRSRMATTHDGYKQHVMTTRPGDDQENSWVVPDVHLYLQLVEQVHNIILSPRVPKLCELANYTNITWDILHTDTHVMSSGRTKVGPGAT